MRTDPLAIPTHGPLAQAWKQHTELPRGAYWPSFAAGWASCKEHCLTLIGAEQPNPVFISTTPEQAEALRQAFAEAQASRTQLEPGNKAATKRRRVCNVGDAFTHTGTVVAEFKTVGGEPRVVVEFDHPVGGLLQVCRPDQLKDAPPPFEFIPY